jgi:hypothetical protein
LIVGTKAKIQVKSVFLSYSSRDYGWVEQFKDEYYFVRRLGNYKICDYMVSGDELPFGKLSGWLEDKVEQCVAMFAFMSESYLQSRASDIEFRAGLRRLAEDKIIFAPVMLDVTAKEFWKELKDDPAYRDILLDYMYCDFTDGGMPVELFPRGRRNLGAMNGISSLADLVASKIEVRETGGEKGGDVSDRPAPTLAGRQASGTSGAGVTANVGTREPASLVLLGDPSNPTPAPEVAANFDTLSRTLSERGIAFRKWPHAWRDATIEPREKVTPPATFVRIVTPLDIRDEEDGPRTLRWINECDRVDGRVDGEVVLWRPRDEKFEWRHASPALRQDSVEALAKWLSDRFRPDDGDAPTLLIIDEPQYDALEEAPYSDVVRMVCELTRMPLRGKSMNAEEFSRFIVDSRDRKLIIAVLDNNVNMTVQGGCGPVERFEEIVERWQDEIQCINAQKGFEVEVVWVAVVARLAPLYPLSTWNKRTLEPINVLRVFKKEQPSGRAKFEPDMDSASRVARALRGLLPTKPTTSEERAGASKLPHPK